MATILIRFYVEELETVMDEYDQIKVYRSSTEGGTYAEITDAGTRIDLVADVAQYEYVDTTAPTPLYWYKTAYYHSVDLVESPLSDPIQGSDPGLYVTLQDIRDEGLSSSDLSDDRALMLSVGWQSWFEQRTGQWFTPRSLTMDFDGDGSRVLFLDVPVISVDELYINEDFDNVVDTTEYTVYNRRYPEDDRRNPRIKLKRKTRSIFEGGRNQIFEVGDMNQRVVGSFGYTEEDGTPPFMVQRAIMTLIFLTAESKGDGDIDSFRSGMTVEEVTDRHRIRYANLYDELGAWNPTGIKEVDEALMLYRRPARVTMARSFIL